jgi:hypothetical protein
MWTRHNFPELRKLKQAAMTSSLRFGVLRFCASIDIAQAMCLWVNQSALRTSVLQVSTLLPPGTLVSYQGDGEAGRWYPGWF